MTCKRCGGEGARMRPNPFRAEIEGDFTPHALCDECVELIREDI